MKFLSLSFLDLPTPVNLNSLFKFGSMLGLVYVIQTISGLLLSLLYYVGEQGAFGSVVEIMVDNKMGWVVRLVHSFGSSVLLLLLYLHIVRGLVYSGVKMHLVWMSGLVFYGVYSSFFFLGYVLPWGQMSYWGMTVVTSMLGAIPVLGDYILDVLWGSKVAGVVSLVRFYSLHYLLSFFMGLMIFIHLVVLHEKGSSNPLGVYSSSDKVMFHPLFSLSDLVGFVFVFVLYWAGVFFLAYGLMDETNFEEVNYLATPEHIKPEWYFLFAYCILRSVNSKLGGVVLMFLAIGVLSLVVMVDFKEYKSLSFSWVMKLIIVILVISFVMLSVLGGLSVEYPYDVLSKSFTSVYFSCIFIFSLMGGLF
uniref:Cytochrome b n=1 Tax=Paratenuisentis ambiguus TaxID=185730 RepID=K0JA10_PARAB|nr:cytochrome b [Paratenuisentis ambiguus]CCA94483.2 cytochrome B [Paratenuisentis ambiguus]